MADIETEKEIDSEWKYGELSRKEAMDVAMQLMLAYRNLLGISELPKYSGDKPALNIITAQLGDVCKFIFIKYEILPEEVEAYVKENFTPEKLVQVLGEETKEEENKDVMFM